ncbi:Glycerol-3-phosphate/dihydroxyacetone phosphate acyltransferase [Rhizopus azygosporus]|uniref:Glycerol-3-phosphate/dihydroxyacetone phosphate acyltransferase n=1 Tax=Rhizopus azygosporus TaxID=86630 RepID=A0A367K1K0_RHIAZ|nr:Glycerol-3-phosphate/dihydroxyacetone phosphate acyltransferase [Rhizopus azygosporus]
MKGKLTTADILYDCAAWLFNIMLDVFFREIRPRGSHKIPKEGPLIFVAAPHANQVREQAEEIQKKTILTCCSLLTR